MADDRGFLKEEFALDGRLITSTDPSMIGAKNFRSLVNMRYKAGHPQGIGGMSKINTTALTPKPNVRSMFHFSKDQPSESHLIAQCWNATLDKSAVYQNTTAIPNAGNFSSTVLMTDDAGSDIGTFSMAPVGNMIYCNKKGAYIWGGTEMRLGAFINFDPAGTFTYDFTENLRDTLTTGAAHTATLARVAETGSDPYTSLLMHFTSNCTTDSSASSHTAVNTATTLTTREYPFAPFTTVASLNGSTSRIRVRDRAGWNFSGGNFAIDCRMRVRSAATLNPIFYQRNAGATNYIKFYTTDTGRLKLAIRRGSATLDVKTNTAAIQANTWYHIEVDESGNEYRLFINGQQYTYRSSTVRARDLRSSLDLGWDRSNYYNGFLEELRVSKITRHTSNFIDPAEPYSNVNTYNTYFYIGSTRPLQGFKVYITTPNLTAGVMGVKYWSGSQWLAVTSLVDNTVSLSCSLRQTHTVTFDSTVAIAKMKVINGIMLYWYRVSVSNCDATTTLSRVTLNAPMQPVKDVWDGIQRPILSFQKWDGTTYHNFTNNVYKDDYDSMNRGTYASLDSLLTTQYLVCGFDERMTGIYMNIVSDKTNSLGSVASVYYWNGTAWTSVGTVTDETSENGISLAKSGIISWSPIAEGIEFQRIVTAVIKPQKPANVFGRWIAGRGVTEITTGSAGEMLYYYKIVWSATLDPSVLLQYVAGIPAQKTINAYAFPVFSMNRVWLLCEQDKYKNKALLSGFDTAEEFNGDDNFELFFGDDSALVAGAPIFMQVGSNFYQGTLICKQNETWMVINKEDGFTQFRVSDIIGCAAPNTMRSVGLAGNDISVANREVVIWQGSEGIYQFDGKTPIPIHGDIEDRFDKRNTYSINRNKIHLSQAFVDLQNQEYHWLYTSQACVNTMDKEMVYDLRKQKWYEINRNLATVTSFLDTGGMGVDFTDGSEIHFVGYSPIITNSIQCGCIVKDTNGNTYNYGAKARYVERLEYGNSFDGTTITHTVWPGDLVFNRGSISEETTARVFQLVTKATNVTNNKINVEYYKDGSNTPDTSWTMAPQISGKRIARPLIQLGQEGPVTFHSVKMTASTDNEPIGFEPMYASFLYKSARQRTYGGN